MEQIKDFREGVELAKKLLAYSVKPSPFSPNPVSEANAMKAQLLQSKGSYMIDENPNELIEKASSDPDYFDALRYGGAAHLYLDNSLPKSVRHWLAEYLQGKKKRPRRASGRGSSIGWHINIAFTVDLLIGAGMTATRNDGSDETSACDAVAHALLELGRTPNSFSRVKKIWFEIKRAKDECGVIRFEV